MLNSMLLLRTTVRGSLHTSQISHLLLYPLLWLLVPGLSSHFLLYNLLLTLLLVGNIFEKWLQKFCKLWEPLCIIFARQIDLRLTAIPRGISELLRNIFTSLLTCVLIHMYKHIMRTCATLACNRSTNHGYDFICVHVCTRRT